MKALQKVAHAFDRLTARGKEDWEFVWQKNRWAPLFAEKQVQDRVLHYWRTHRFLDEILALVNLRPDSTILDVGCGISTVLHFLPGVRIGLDPIAHRYRSVYDYPEDILIVSGYGEVLPFENGAFNLVTCSNCIDHTQDPRATVAEVARVTKPGGAIVITCEIFKEDHGKRNKGHPHSMTEKTLLDLVSRLLLREHWVSPWVGLERYVRGKARTSQEEHILLLENQPSHRGSGRRETSASAV